jgi:periplasmic divalent cation tolerance protein
VTGFGAIARDETEAERVVREPHRPGRPAVDEICDVTITAASIDWLVEFTRGLVADRLAACGNISTSAVRSIYRWDGAIEDDTEAVVVLHTRRSLMPEIVERTNAEHDYDTPQVLAVPVVAANPAYQQWVLDETREPAER